MDVDLTIRASAKVDCYDIPENQVLSRVARCLSKSTVIYRSNIHKIGGSF